jgi:hypothetical protein
MRLSGSVQVFGRRDAETISGARAPASENLHNSGPRDPKLGALEDGLWLETARLTHSVNRPPLIDALRKVYSITSSAASIAAVESEALATRHR